MLLTPALVKVVQFLKKILRNLIILFMQQKKQCELLIFVMVLLKEFWLRIIIFMIILFHQIQNGSRFMTLIMYYNIEFLMLLKNIVKNTTYHSTLFLFLNKTMVKQFMKILEAINLN